MLRHSFSGWMCKTLSNVAKIVCMNATNTYSLSPPEMKISGHIGHLLHYISQKIIKSLLCDFRHLAQRDFNQ